MSAPTRPAVTVPIDGLADRDRWDAATAALDATFGGAVAVGAVVRGFVVARIAAGQ
jgi:hypothetical protein